jgi:hypothetical protein
MIVHRDPIHLDVARSDRARRDLDYHEIGGGNPLRARIVDEILVGSSAVRQSRTCDYICAELRHHSLGRLIVKSDSPRHEIGLREIM